MKTVLRKMKLWLFGYQLTKLPHDFSGPAKCFALTNTGMTAIVISAPMTLERISGDGFIGLYIKL